jgi:hypothetical protein
MVTRFQQALLDAVSSNDVSQLIAGQPWMRDGNHNVKITAAVISDDPQYGTLMKVTFANEKEETNTSTFYCDGKDKEGKYQIGYKYAQLITALFQEAKTVKTFSAAVGANQEFAEVITGMKLSLTMAPGKGVRVEALPLIGDALPTYAGFDETGNKVTGDFASTKEVRDFVKANGDKVSYPTIVALRCTHKLENTAALHAGIENSKKAATKPHPSF